MIDTGHLYRDNNLERLASLPSESVDLIYLDPPFFSNRIYEVIWGDEAEVRSFEDRWDGGLHHYTEWMRERVAEMHRLLRDTGSLYLHCDPHASHYLKVMLDQVFGESAFASEIAWKRYGSHNDAKRNYGAVHDSILYYRKTPAATFNVQRSEHDPAYVERSYRKTDKDGRRWRSQNLASPQPRPNLTYEYEALNGVTYQPHPNGWKYTPERMRELDDAGRLVYPRKPTGRLALKNYLDEMPGPPLSDLWTDVRSLSGSHAERQGYPTQKPEALLERIIAVSSNEGDVVLDPFCGCGTTVAAAHRLARRWVGIDISTSAMRVMRKRLWNQFRFVPEFVNMPETEESVRNLKPFEFQNWVIDTMNGSHSTRKTGDMGIDGYSFFERLPIQVKRSDKVGRNVVDNFETAIRREGNDAGYIVAFSFTRGAFEEVARAKSEGLRITLVRVKELLLLQRRPGKPQPKFLPQPEGEVLPMPEHRDKKDMPTVEELVASDLTATAAGA